MLIEKASFMKGKWIWLLLVVLVAGGAAGYLTRDRESPPLAQYRSVARHVLSTHTKHQPPENRITACSSADCKAVAAVLQPEAKEKKEAAEKEEIYAMFSADAHGNLVLNEKTRLNIEKLCALNTPDELAEKMQKLSKVLPDSAQRQVANLLDYFVNYTRNVKISYPPDEQPATLEEVIERFKGMHDLRLAYFGADVASAFYAEEEKQSLQLLYLMAIEKDEELSLDQKVERAQQHLQTHPELAAAYDPDRK
ncbi:MAG: lipase chaperone [Deltaproteobacteria bacterium]|jgi:hypothetical protein|nr:hypothetical protein [Syntrophaceae bacterium]